MEPGPVPPHERTWRHPSEIAAEQHASLRAESATPISRLFAISTGTIGLIAVGLLVLVVTPRAADAPLAISATTTPGPAIAAVDVAAGVTGRTVLGLRAGDAPLATPVGDGRFAFARADARVGTSIEVRLLSGASGAGRVLAREAGTVLVELDVAEPGHDLADTMPADDDVVTVMVEPPVTIALADLAALEIEEGTAVLDDRGRLVGLCRRRGGAVHLDEISDELAAATSGG